MLKMKRCYKIGWDDKNGLVLKELLNCRQQFVVIDSQGVTCRTCVQL